ncbi:MAG TPA: hypothetical protein VES19_09455 [Candidatus Limnocylindrales bacterium]|nr:hypothetical protein [Candidatus Limnocylindrales bacterium]
MHEPLHLAGVDHLVPERIHDLHLTACETKGIRRDHADRTGLLTRTRGSVGRRLISLGSTVAGHGS